MRRMNIISASAKFIMHLRHKSLTSSKMQANRYQRIFTLKSGWRTMVNLKTGHVNKISGDRSSANGTDQLIKPFIYKLKSRKQWK